MSIQKKVFENLKTILETEISWANYVEYERIRLLTSEFNLHELPAIQIFDNGESATNLQALTENVLSISIEIVMTRSSTELVDQGLLLDRKLEVKRAVGKDPRLGIISTPSEGAFKHIQYVGGVTDLHSLDPHYLARLDFEALFTEPFVREC